MEKGRKASKEKRSNKNWTDTATAMKAGKAVKLVRSSESDEKLKNI